MKKFYTLRKRMDLLFISLIFLKKHYAILLALGLIAAFGRVIQLCGFGEITP